MKTDWTKPHYFKIMNLNDRLCICGLPEDNPLHITEEQECWDRQPSKPIFTLEDVEEILGEEDFTEMVDGEEIKYSAKDMELISVHMRNKLRHEQRQRLSAKMEKL